MDGSTFKIIPEGAEITFEYIDAGVPGTHQGLFQERVDFLDVFVVEIAGRNELFNLSNVNDIIILP